ncbi:hypothetical protein MBLNU457_g2492t1 [Dothideomycetes sp. NU457]
MRSTIAVASLMALISTAAAGTVSVVNNCAEQKFLTITRSNQQSTTQAIAGHGGSYKENISGQGNSFGITNNNQYYSANTPKLIFGFSDAPPTLYYTVSSVNGDPQAGEKFSLNTACGSVTSYDGLVHTCTDGGDFTLALC